MGFCVVGLGFCVIRFLGELGDVVSELESQRRCLEVEYGGVVYVVNYRWLADDVVVEVVESGVLRHKVSYQGFWEVRAVNVESEDVKVVLYNPEREQEKRLVLSKGAIQEVE